MKKKLNFDPQDRIYVIASAIVYYKQKAESARIIFERENQKSLEHFKENFPHVMTEFFEEIQGIEAVIIHFTCDDEAAIREVLFIPESMGLNAPKRGFKSNYSGVPESYSTVIEFTVNDKFYTKLKFEKEFNAKKRAIIRSLNKFIWKNEAVLVQAFAEPHHGIMFTKTGKIFKAETC